MTSSVQVVRLLTSGRWRSKRQNAIRQLLPSKYNDLGQWSFQGVSAAWGILWHNLEDYHRRIWQDGTGCCYRYSLEIVAQIGLEPCKRSVMDSECVVKIAEKDWMANSVKLKAAERLRSVWSKTFLESEARSHWQWLSWLMLWCKDSIAYKRTKPPSKW